MDPKKTLEELNKEFWDDDLTGMTVYNPKKVLSQLASVHLKKKKVKKVIYYRYNYQRLSFKEFNLSE